MSLFTRVPLAETLDLLIPHFEEDTQGLFCHVLTTSYFTFSGQLYGMDMGSPLSPVFANFYLEDYEKAVNWPALKSCSWFAA
jgi:hypothetical protein